MLVYYSCFHTITLYFYSTVLCVVAWIMKTVGGLKSFVDHFKNDINERNELQAPMMQKRASVYIHTNIASQRLENTRSIISSILEHSAGSSVTTTPDTAPQHLVCRAVQSLHINRMQMGIIEVFICRRLHMNTSTILICIWQVCRLCTTLHTKCCGAV